MNETITEETPDPNVNGVWLYHSSYVTMRERFKQRASHLRGELRPSYLRTLFNHGRMLQVTCPKCWRGPGAWCRIATTNRLKNTLHVARWQQVLREGWQFVRSFELPDVEGER